MMESSLWSCYPNCMSELTISGGRDVENAFALFIDARKDAGSPVNLHEYEGASALS
jgi:hypothetical protein